MLLRSSVKLIKAAYVFAALLAAAILVFSYHQPEIAGLSSDWLLLIPAAIASTAAFKHLVRLGTKLIISEDRVRYETGIVSKTTRVMELVKVQDVRTDQTFGQRLIGVGNVSLETAGETSRIEIASVDEPRKVADHILEMARLQRQKS
jgi:membrane protein YdbS with pleckstrin-like domain